MVDILVEPCVSDIVQALEANLQAHAQLYAGLPGAMICDAPGVIGLMTDLDVSESCIYRANFLPEQAEEKIEQVLQRYRSLGCLPMWWIVGPCTQPAELGKQLERQGFQHFARPPGMAADLHSLAEQPALPADFIIERVSDTYQLGQWTEIVGTADEISEALKNGFYEVFASQGFGPDAPCRLFLGMENGQPVAASRLFCAGGVAGIYHVATLPKARGRGYGTAMTLAVAKAARDLGYRVGGLFATPAGYRLYHRLGFQAVFTMDVYQSPT
jgi:GNAT superfamily N-acetyltransferase